MTNENETRVYGIERLRRERVSAIYPLSRAMSVGNIYYILYTHARVLFNGKNFKTEWPLVISPWLK